MRSDLGFQIADFVEGKAYVTFGQVGAHLLKWLRISVTIIFCFLSLE